MRFLISAALATALLVPGPRAYADSPLTSTSFAMAYHDAPAVQRALQGAVGEDWFAMLVDPEVGSDVRAAAVNALGWSEETTTIAVAFVSYLSERRGMVPSTVQVVDLSAEEAFSLGYMVALARYGTLDGLSPGAAGIAGASPMELLAHAAAEAPNDAAIRVVSGLVEAQRAMQRSWCAVYEIVAEDIQAPGEDRLNPAAIGAIMAYIDLYQPECAVEAELPPGPDGSVLSGH